MSNENPNPEDNSAIRAMRAQIDTANADKKAAEDAAKAAETARLAAEAKLQEIERSKLDETERLRLERDDLAKQAAELAPLRDEIGRFQAKAEADYTTQIAAIPEELRASAEKLSKNGTWAERLEALAAAKALMPEAVTHVSGNPNKPGTPNPEAKTLPNGQPDYRGSWDFKPAGKAAS